MAGCMQWYCTPSSSALWTWQVQPTLWRVLSFYEASLSSTFKLHMNLYLAQSMDTSLTAAKIILSQFEWSATYSETRAKYMANYFSMCFKMSRSCTTFCSSGLKRGNTDSYRNHWNTQNKTPPLQHLSHWKQNCAVDRRLQTPKSLYQAF